MGRLEEETTAIDPLREKVVNTLFHSSESFLGVDESEHDEIEAKKPAMIHGAVAVGTPVVEIKRGSLRSSSSGTRMEFLHRIRKESLKSGGTPPAEVPSPALAPAAAPAGKDALVRPSTARAVCRGTSSSKHSPPLLERQTRLAPQSRVGAVAVIPAGIADNDDDDDYDQEEWYMEDTMDREENSDDVSIDSRSTMGSQQENDFFLPEATVIPASLVKKEEETEHQLQQLQKEMEDKQQEMAAVREKLARMEKMEQELKDLKIALQGKVAVAELVDSTPVKDGRRQLPERGLPEKEKRRSARNCSSSSLQPKRTGSTKRIVDPIQAKAAAAALAPEDRKKMKEKGMDVVDFMVYQALVGSSSSLVDKHKEGKNKEMSSSSRSFCEARKNGMSRGSARSYTTFTLGSKKCRGSSELTDATTLTEDGVAISGSSRALGFDDRPDGDEPSQEKSVDSLSASKRRFQNPVKKLYRKVVKIGR